MSTITGRCLCGAVTVTVGEARRDEVGACHCRMCQRWSGGLYVSFPAEAEAVTVTGEVRRFASSPFAERAFCPACGSHLWYRGTGEEADGHYSFMPGLFDAARTFPLGSEIYADRAYACVRLSGEHPRETRAEVEAQHRHVEGDLA